MTRPVWKTPFVANPVVTWGVMLVVAAAEVWAVAVVSDAVPAVAGTAEKNHAKAQQTHQARSWVVQGSSEVGAAAAGVAGRVGGSTLAFTFSEYAESFHGPSVNNFGRAHHRAKGAQPECRRETRRRSPTDRPTEEAQRTDAGKPRAGEACQSRGMVRGWLDRGHSPVDYGRLEPQARGWWRNARGGWVRDWGRRMSRSPLQPGRTSGVTESVGIYIRRGSLHFAIAAVHI